jgi:hypothetical protein
MDLLNDTKNKFLIPKVTVNNTKNEDLYFDDQASLSNSDIHFV